MFLIFLGFIRVNAIVPAQALDAIPLLPYSLQQRHTEILHMA